MSKSERIGSRRRRPAPVARRRSRAPLYVVAAAIVLGGVIATLVVVLAPPTVPSFEQRTGAQASQAATAARLKLAEIPNPDGKSCQPGHKPEVISQFPSPGTDIPTNKTVSVVYDCKG